MLKRKRFLLISQSVEHNYVNTSNALMLRIKAGEIMEVTLAEKNTSSGTLIQIHGTAAKKALPTTVNSLTGDTTMWSLTVNGSAR